MQNGTEANTCGKLAMWLERRDREMERDGVCVHLMNVSPIFILFSSV